MNTKQIELEKILYLIALLFAISLRLFRLGAMPLSDAEAVLALQASSWGQGFSSVPQPYPAYLSLTGFTFILFSANNFLARMWPAIAGGLIVVAPYWLRNRLGRRTAILLALALAVDPGLVTTARLSTGSAFVMSGLVLAIVWWWAGKSVLAGISAGIALLGGPAILPAGLILVITFLIWRWLESRRKTSTDALDAIQPESVDPVPVRVFLWKSFLLAAGLTMLIFGTSWMFFPQSLGSWLAVIPAYLNGWFTPGITPALRFPAALLIYQTLPILFIVWGLVDPSARLSHLGQATLVATGVALFVVILYPARQVSDLVWVVIPLWALAVHFLDHFLSIESVKLPVAASLAGLTVFFLALFWFTMAGLGQSSIGVTLRWLVMISTLALLGVAITLVYMQWGSQSARTGLAVGLVIGLGIQMFSGLWNAAYLQIYRPVDLWLPAPYTGDADLLVDTIGDLSEYTTGQRTAVDVYLAIDSPALEWVLRDYPNLERGAERQALRISGSPSIILTTPTQDAPSLTSGYRGQDFVWWVNPGWSGALPPDWLAWYTRRQAPLQMQQIILWVRSDLFPGEVSVFLRRNSFSFEQPRL